jgi:hypothetical protein
MSFQPVLDSSKYFVCNRGLKYLLSRLVAIKKLNCQHLKVEDGTGN